MKKRTKWIIAAIVVVGAGGAGAAYMQQRGPQSVEVKVEAVEKRQRERIGPVLRQPVRVNPQPPEIRRLEPDRRAPPRHVRRS